MLTQSLSVESLTLPAGQYIGGTGMPKNFFRRSQTLEWILGSQTFLLVSDARHKPAPRITSVISTFLEATIRKNCLEKLPPQISLESARA